MKIFERVHRDIPLDKLRWFIDHAETATDQTLVRIKALGGGIAIQHRMAYQGEYYVRRYGLQSAQARPPIRKMLSMGLPVGAGTDGTRVASYHPWTCMWWLVTGKTVGGLVINPDPNERLSRVEALRLYTQGSAWFSSDEENKGTLRSGQMADFAVLSADYLQIPDDEIRALESVLTVLGGRVVHGTQEFQGLAPDLPPASPSWSPTARFSGYDNSDPTPHDHTHPMVIGADGRLWESGCGCWF